MSQAVSGPSFRAGGFGSTLRHSTLSFADPNSTCFPPSTSPFPCQHHSMFSSQHITISLSAPFHVFLPAHHHFPVSAIPCFPPSTPPFPCQHHSIFSSQHITISLSAPFHPPTLHIISLSAPFHTSQHITIPCQRHSTHQRSTLIFCSYRKERMATSIKHNLYCLVSER